MAEKQKFKWHSWATPWVLIFPTLVGLVVFRLIPIVSSLVLSFTKWNLITDPKFLGLKNYVDLFTDPDFWKILGNTLKITVGYVAGSMVFGLLLALLVNNKIRGMNFFRAAIYMPVITSSVAVGIVWTRILGPKYGILDFLLKKIGITAPYWLQDPKLALWTLTFVQVWKMAGYYMILFLAGLQSISHEVIEASIVDGATPTQRLFRVTIPMLAPTSFFVLTVAIMDAFKNFELIYAMTMGGPQNATNTLVYSVYLNAFSYNRVGYAESIAWVLMVVVGALTILNFFIKKYWAQPLE
ncbi:MAG: sugar ABC transporter permease [Spirochaetales bacterium]|nr:sugar ABC transporter permease [Spirochaetales bacterium]MBR5098983.1 sugar ABC transporter permease [Spirochaetales bacterium]